MKIRRSAERDTAELARLHRGTIRHVNSRDYSPPQIEAGAGRGSAAKFRRSHQTHIRFVATERGKITEFTDFGKDGSSGGLYVHKDFVGKGVGMARQLTDTVDGILLSKRYLILDRDTKRCQAFRDFVKREGIEVIRLPPRSPNLNAYAERWVGGVRDECLFEADPDWEGDAAACAARIPRPIFTMSGTTRV
jgi:transposase InsO family protein